MKVIPDGFGFYDPHQRNWDLENEEHYFTLHYGRLILGEKIFEEETITEKEMRSRFKNVYITER